MNDKEKLESFSDKFTCMICDFLMDSDDNLEEILEFLIGVTSCLNIINRAYKNDKRSTIGTVEEGEFSEHITEIINMMRRREKRSKK